MILTLRERSEYFRGLLVLMKMDRKIDDEERKILFQVGNLLGFERKFCDNAINEIMENEFVSEEIPVFSTSEFAKSFIIDGLKLAVSDRELNPDELSFLKDTLDKNNIDQVWFNETVKMILENVDYDSDQIELMIKKYLD